MLFCKLGQLRRRLVKISVAPAVGTAKQLGPLPQQLSQAKSFVFAVSELWPISPFKYILDINVQHLLFLFPYPCIQIMNCSATSQKRNYRCPNKFKVAEAGRVFLRGWCGEGELQAVQALWAQHSTEREWLQRSLLRFWIIYFEEEIFLHWDVGCLCDQIDCLQLKSRRQKTTVYCNRASQRVSGYMSRKTYTSGGMYLIS